MTEKKTRIPASPNVRKFARELGLDINLVTGSERQGRVIENDVKKLLTFFLCIISTKVPITTSTIIRITKDCNNNGDIEVPNNSKGFVVKKFIRINFYIVKCSSTDVYIDQLR